MAPERYYYTNDQIATWLLRVDPIFGPNADPEADDDGLELPSMKIQTSLALSKTMITSLSPRTPRAGRRACFSPQQQSSHQPQQQLDTSISPPDSSLPPLPSPPSELPPPPPPKPLGFMCPLTPPSHIECRRGGAGGFSSFSLQADRGKRPLPIVPPRNPARMAGMERGEVAAK